MYTHTYMKVTTLGLTMYPSLNTGKQHHSMTTRNPFFND